MESDTNEDAVSDIARTIANETRISFKQATALLMREILDKKDKEIAEVLDVAPASTSSYISACREKFDSVNEEIAQLEQRIIEWEKTEQLEDILDRFDSVSSDTDIKQLAQTVQNELVDDEDVTYLISFIDEQGDERIQSISTHPREIENREILQYKRISSIDEVFE